MTTKSITQGKPRPRTQLDKDTGKPDVVDQHPLITCAPHIMSGHAHLKANRVTIERVLLAEMQRIEGPLTMASGVTLTEQDRRAVFRYSIAIFQEISKLYAELGRLRSIVPKGAQK